MALGLFCALKFIVHKPILIIAPLGFEAALLSIMASSIEIAPAAYLLAGLITIFIGLSSP